TEHRTSKRARFGAQDSDNWGLHAASRVLTAPHMSASEQQWPAFPPPLTDVAFFQFFCAVAHKFSASLRPSVPPSLPPSLSPSLPLHASFLFHYSPSPLIGTSFLG